MYQLTSSQAASFNILYIILDVYNERRRVRVGRSLVSSANYYAAKDSSFILLHVKNYFRFSKKNNRAPMVS